MTPENVNSRGSSFPVNRRKKISGTVGLFQEEGAGALSDRLARDDRQATLALLRFVIVHDHCALSFLIRSSVRRDSGRSLFNESFQFAGRNQHAAADLDRPELALFNQIVEAAHGQGRGRRRFSFRVRQ